MKLRGTIDRGNTRCKSGLFDSRGELIQVEIFDDVTTALLWLKNNKAQDAIISDVKNIQTIPENILPLKFVDQYLKLPFKNEYKTPATLGADRIAVMAAAATIFPKNSSIVFDIGTCMTIDILYNGENYTGGNISPGLQMRLKAMHEFTGKLPLASMDHINFELGNDTLSALANGAASGMLNEIEGYISKLMNIYTDLKIFMCGGDSHYFEKQLKYKIFADQNLVLLGLYHLLEFND